jgi:hypothetical protein
MPKHAQAAPHLFHQGHYEGNVKEEQDSRILHRIGTILQRAEEAAAAHSDDPRMRPEVQEI